MQSERSSEQTIESTLPAFALHRDTTYSVYESPVASDKSNSILMAN